MTVRAFLRAVSQSEWSVEFAAARLRVTRRRAGHVIKQLVELGYVEVASTKGDRSYKRSLAGSTLGPSFRGSAPTTRCRRAEAGRLFGPRPSSK